jgi:hypothetical protein
VLAHQLAGGEIVNLTLSVSVIICRQPLALLEDCSSEHHG